PLDDYFFDKNIFKLNENYSITPIALRFMYNQYEIKPYASGQTELLIPYSEISKLMRPQSVASQYLHKNAGI
ncbi:RsiV family protein, partial [Mucilaginibacter sp. 5B2]|nr:RsiV family protein [Mucilaginibacter sp. 5B2]